MHSSRVSKPQPKARLRMLGTLQNLGQLSTAPPSCSDGRLDVVIIARVLQSGLSEPDSPLASPWNEISDSYIRSRFSPASIMRHITWDHREISKLGEFPSFPTFPAESDSYRGVEH